MASFETVVRPVVFPNIRPAPAQSLPPGDEPDKGLAVIHGNGGKQVTLSNSWSGSASSNSQRETQRRVDTGRVYQKDDDGVVNKENFVDFEYANKIWTTSANGVATVTYARAEEADNIKILERDKMKVRS